MTKYEWERELKKHIAVLPKSEQTKIFDYYNEIFEDRIEAGMRENDIIYEFGNPFDVAQKILADYRYDETETVRPPRYRPEREEKRFDESPREEKHFDEPPREERAAPPRQTANFDAPPAPKAETRSEGWFGRLLLMFFLYLFLGLPVLIVMVALAAAGLGLAVGCIAMIAGGFAQAVYWFVQMAIVGGVASCLALAGVGLFAAGLGFVFVTPCAKLAKWVILGAFKILKATFNYIRGKKAVRE